MLNMNYPNAGSPSIEQILLFHDWVITFLIAISVGTLASMFIIMKRTRTHRGIEEAQTVECIWTVAPAALLLAIVLPSLRLLYLVEENADGGPTIKAIGHQWY